MEGGFAGINRSDPSKKILTFVHPARTIDRQTKVNDFMIQIASLGPETMISVEKKLTFECVHPARTTDRQTKVNDFMLGIASPRPEPMISVEKMPFESVHPARTTDRQTKVNGFMIEIASPGSETMISVKKILTFECVHPTRTPAGRRKSIVLLDKICRARLPKCLSCD